MGMYRLIQKWGYRTFHVIKLLVSSFFVLKKRGWFNFWFTNKDQVIEIDSINFQIANTSFVNKISELGMLFEVLVFRHYNLCEIKDSDIVIDIGAHVGSFTLLASKKAATGKVYAYEPYPVTYDKLTKNIHLNDKGNVFAFNKAVSGTDAKSTLYISKINPAENSLCKVTGDKILVDTVTLPRIFLDNNLVHCNVLKLDCEGSEYDILLSSEKMMGKIDQIILEYHEPLYFNLPSKFSVEKLVDYLEKNRFKVKRVKSNHYQGVIYGKKEHLQA